VRYSALAVLLALAVSCGRQETPGFRRVALLPIENLDAAEDGRYAAEAVRMAIWESLQAQPGVHAATVNHRRELPGLSAVAVDGYYAGGRFRLQVGAKPVECAGSLQDCVGRIVSAVAAELGVTARPIPTAETLVRLARREGFEQAAAADSGFATVWLAWSSSALRSGGAAGALAILERAPVARMSPFDAGRLRVRTAELKQDRAGHANAMRELARLAPADVELQERAARELTMTRNFAAALEIYEGLLRLAPSAPVQNQAAYLAAHTGDRAKAEQFAAAAQAAAPLDAQYMDTRGEIAYFFGDYGAAAQFFEQAVGLNVAFMNGIELWKAADAARMAGDKARAEGFATRYFEFREKAGPTNTAVLKAVWEWGGDDPDAALERLRGASNSMFRGRALLLRALMALNRKQSGAAEQMLREMEPQSAEAAFLRSLLTDAPLPPGFPMPPDGLAALRLYLRGDSAAAKTALAKARDKMDPLTEGQWKKLAAILEGKKPEGLTPPSPDDWLAVLLR